jgi:hypothetical protein
MNQTEGEFRDKAKGLVTPTVLLLTSASDINAFREGTLWKDIQTFLRQGLENLRDELETMGAGTGYSPEEIPYAMAFLQGQAFQNRLLLDLVDLMLTFKEEEPNGTDSE